MTDMDTIEATGQGEEAIDNQKEHGVLYLGMKDDWRHWDNSGKLTVIINVKRKLFEPASKK